MPNEYAGSAAYANWVYSGGTEVLSGWQRTFKLTPSTEFIDATAGSDQYKVKIPSFTDIMFSASGVAQTGGTALEDALAEGTQGTINYYPEGTASGNRQHIIGAFSHGLTINQPYADVTEWSVDFEGDGNYTRTTV